MSAARGRVYDTTLTLSTKLERFVSVSIAEIVLYELLKKEEQTFFKHTLNTTD